LAEDKKDGVDFLKRNVKLKHIHQISSNDTDIHCISDKIIQKILDNVDKKSFTLNEVEEKKKKKKWVEAPVIEKKKEKPIYTKDDYDRFFNKVEL